MAERFPFGPPSGGEYVPVVSVIFDDTQARVTPQLTATVDTGADGTIVPIALLAAAGFSPSRQRRRLVPASATAAYEIVPGYLLNLQIGSLKLLDIDVYGSRTIDEVILGRNVLNKLAFLYDGPQRSLELLSA
jgi:predicted aspartyl protease